MPITLRVVRCFEIYISVYYWENFREEECYDFSSIFGLKMYRWYLTMHQVVYKIRYKLFLSNKPDYLG